MSHFRAGRPGAGSSSGNPATMETIFVAGATGFIGRNLVRVLLEKGHKVRCLARSENSAEKCRARGIEPFAGDIGKPETL
ncbi:MAG: NAD-dependent epimerase/dehydratase family protein, partial [Gammaproteobacteria bacterium]|nr:NAD-dependent epimerase/dehydratase family protein [Gammaproteobacteria bacterium]NIW98103.1 NAD-dependent epimerase/dehydratase family protein [Phycisphaerae bacterium]